MENENIKEFTKEVENKVEETTEVVEVKTNKLVEKWNGLKTWQKVGVIFLLTGSVVGGVFAITKLMKTNPEVVSEAIETVTENPEVVADSIEAAAI